MLGSIYIVLHIIVFVNCQMPEEDLPAKPEKCIKKAEFLDRQCCIFPPFFARDIARQCGATTEVKFTDRVANVTAFTRNTVNDCTHWTCILTKYNLINNEGFLDEDKYFAHLDRWIELNQDFSSAMFNAKVACKQVYRMYIPLNPCDFFTFQSCIRHQITVDCPRIITTPECIAQKEYFEECREFYQAK